MRAGSIFYSYFLSQYLEYGRCLVIFDGLLKLSLILSSGGSGSREEAGTKVVVTTEGPGDVCLLEHRGWACRADIDLDTLTSSQLLDEFFFFFFF